MLISCIKKDILERNKKILIIGAWLFAGAAAYIYFRKKSSVSKAGIGLQIPNILIGDSQTPYLANQTKKFQLISRVGSEDSLWKGGEDLTWLKNAVEKFQYSPDVENVAIVIGTNGGFRSSDDVIGLFNNLKSVFPNANFYAIKGSWGWGGNVGVTTSKVDAYYQRFRNEGAEIIEPAIGVTSNPHGNLPVYKTIADNLDSKI